VVQDLGMTEEPQPGQDVTLSIDAKLQQSVYDALEAKIAEVLCLHLINEKSFDRTAIAESTEIRTPIYDVYSALFTNHVINTERFGAGGATALEQEILGRYQAEKALVLAAIEADLSDGTVPYAEQGE